MKSKSFFKASSFGKKRNFMSGSKAKANEGFRMLMNWSSNSCTLRSIVGAAVAFCLIVLVLVYDQSRSIQNGGELSAGSCNCFGGDATLHNTTHYAETSLQSNTAILYLPKPQRPFHGNHWFHIGEYYISRRKLIQDMLAQQERLGPLHHLQIIAQDPKLANMMTKMSFSLIAMSCLSATNDQQLSALQTIELYREADIDITVSAGTALSTAIDSIASAQRVKLTTKQKPLFGYYAQNSVDEMIIEYRTSTSDASDTSTGTSIISSGSSQEGQVGQATQHTKCRKKASFVSLEDIYRWSTEPLFDKSTRTAGCVSVEQCACGVYLGAVGHAPIPSYDWFHSTEDADSLRSTALSMCNIPNLQQASKSPASITSTVTDAHAPRKLTLLIYQRDLNRRFVHLDAIKAALEDRNSISKASNNVKYEWDIRVIMHNEDAAPCDTIRQLHSADILLTAHGFQSTALMFMKPGAVLLEIFPYKYHRTSYYPLSQRFGLHYRSIQNTAPIHSGDSGGITGLVASLATGAPSTQLLKMVSQGACMRDLKCRSYARSRDIMMPKSHMELVLQTMEDVERGRLDIFAVVADV